MSATFTWELMISRHGPLSLPSFLFSLCSTLGILDVSTEFNKRITTFGFFQRKTTIPSLLMRKPVSMQLELLSFAKERPKKSCCFFLLLFFALRFEIWLLDFRQKFLVLSNYSYSWWRKEIIKEHTIKNAAYLLC